MNRQWAMGNGQVEEQQIGKLRAEQSSQSIEVVDGVGVLSVRAAFWISVFGSGRRRRSTELPNCILESRSGRNNGLIVPGKLLPPSSISLIVLMQSYGIPVLEFPYGLM
ncbi:hypothetical protein V6N12_057730 [Hibiscus sabdariffa]|uniref:Uncharacterized protein n=1 Tax=Hibiscus sabdariffa TaxID=183260 RepID=A0ABR2C636_9ROSI